MSFHSDDHAPMANHATLTKAALAILAGLTITMAVTFIVEPAGSWRMLLGMIW